MPANPQWDPHTANRLHPFSPFGRSRIIRAHVRPEDLDPLIVAVGGLPAVVYRHYYPVGERENRQAGVDVARLPDGRVHLIKFQPKSPRWQGLFKIPRFYIGVSRYCEKETQGA